MLKKKKKAMEYCPGVKTKLKSNFQNKEGDSEAPVSGEFIMNPQFNWPQKMLMSSEAALLKLQSIEGKRG